MTNSTLSGFCLLDSFNNADHEIFEEAVKNGNVSNVQMYFKLMSFF